MKTLTTRNGSYLTGNDIADAVLRYGLALSKRRDVAMVNVPFIAADGTVLRVDFMIGWQSDTVAISYAELGDELLEVDTILDLYAREEALNVVHAQAFSDDDGARYEWTSFDSNDFS